MRKNTEIIGKHPLIKRLMTLGLAVFVSALAYAQQKKDIKGTVYDSNGTPVSGVVIKEEGSNTSAITDQYGNYNYQATVGKNLVFSIVGRPSKVVSIEDNTEPQLDVTLVENETEIEAVKIVAVGYGSVRKKDLTGAITTLGENDLAKGVITSTEQALQGRVAGLTIVQGTGDPSSGASMRLRGGTSLTASNNPLVVVDGIPGVDINIVQPSDIKSIDILKDASATAIYGSRGANGVIIITTKSGTKKSQITYNNYAAVGYASHNIDMLSGNQWRNYVRENNVLGAVDYGANTNWQKEMQQVAFSQQHELGLSTASENGGFRASLLYLDNKGIIKTTGLNRLSANISGYQYALKKAIKIDLGVTGNMDKWNPLDYRIFERAFNLNPTIPVKDVNGDYTLVGGSIYENPIEIMNHRIADQKRIRLMGYAKAEAAFNKDLKGVVNVSMEYNGTHAGNYKPTYAIMEGMNEKGWAQKTYGEYINSQVETYLNYNKTWGDHNFGAMGGYSYLENTYEGFGAQRSGFETDLFGYNNLGAGSNYRLGDVYSYKGKSKLASFFGRVNYSYAGKYLFTATIRRDGSSRFGANHKWGTFPSASVAWRVSDENFMASTKKWLDNLKFRAGYGITGNQDGIGEYKSLSILGVGNDSYYDPTTGTWVLAYAPTQNPNPDLKWEQTKQINLGADFSLFDRVNVTFDYYDKKTEDLLYTYQVPQPPYLVGTMLANVGTMRNKGFEVALNTDIIKREDLKLNATVTFAKNKQKIEKLSNKIYQADLIQSGSLHGLSGMSNQYSQIIAEGYAVGTFWGKQYLGLDDKGNFILSEDDRKIGDVQPDFTMGVNINLTYKRFDMSISGYGMFGQDVLNATSMMLYDKNRLPAYNVPDDYLKSPIKASPTYSSYWIEKGSFFRIQNVTMGYTLPLKNYGTSLRIYITGQNLAIFTKYKGTDPEIDNTGLASPGIDRFNNYPRPRTISMGLNFTLSN